MAATTTATAAATAALSGRAAAGAADAPSGGADAYASLKQCFARRIDELQELLDLRVDDSALPLFGPDLRALDAAVADLERTHASLRAQLGRERDAAARLQALLREGGPAEAQEARGRAMAAGLPARLPSLPPGAAAPSSPPRVPRLPPMPAAKVLSLGRTKAAASAEDDDGHGGRDVDDDGENDDDADGSAPPPPPHAGAQQQQQQHQAQAPLPSAPRWYVTSAELAAAPSYMRGRLTLERVNAAVDEAALLAESTARLMSAARSGALARAVQNPDDRRRAAEMYHSAHARPEYGLRGRFWFCDADLRGAGAGAALKADRSGKGLLQLLRHLGRVQEQRLTLECAGGHCSAFVLLSGSGAAGGAAGARRR